MTPRFLILVTLCFAGHGLVGCIQQQPILHHVSLNDDTPLHLRAVLPAAGSGRSETRADSLTGGIRVTHPEVRINGGRSEHTGLGHSVPGPVSGGRVVEKTAAGHSLPTPNTPRTEPVFASRPVLPAAPEELRKRSVAEEVADTTGEQKPSGWLLNDKTANLQTSGLPLRETGHLERSARNYEGASDLPTVADSNGQAEVVAGIADDGPGSLSSALSSENNQPTPPPTVLERLRTFPVPRLDDEASEFLRRPLRTLTNPWNRLLDREPELSASVDAAAADQPESTLSSGQAPAFQPSRSELDTLLSELVERADALITDWPRHETGQPVSPREFQKLQLDRRFLMLLADREADFAGPLSPGSGVSPEFWQELSLALIALRQPLGQEGPAEEQHTEIRRHLSQAVRHLRASESIAVMRLEFARAVQGFGQVDRLPTNEFSPGSRALVYAELENAATALTPDGRVRSRLSAIIQLTAVGEGSPRLTVPFPDIEDLCDSERSDYYHTYELTIPAYIPPGDYSLILRLRDEISGSATSHRLPLRIVGTRSSTNDAISAE